MRKFYTGYSLPGGESVSYEIDYRCPRCESEIVLPEAGAKRPSFCDGSPSTGDELSQWICGDCGARDNGERFVYKVVSDDACPVVSYIRGH